MTFVIFVPFIFSNCESKCVLTEVLLQFLIEKLWPGLLTLSKTFFDVSVLCNRFSEAQKNKFGLHLESETFLKLFDISVKVYY